MTTFEKADIERRLFLYVHNYLNGSSSGRREG